MSPPASHRAAAPGSGRDAPTTTISDVARAARVSPATVSRILNHPEKVAPDKRRRVLDAMRALDYRPSQIARALKSRRHHAIAVAVADSANPFFSALTKELAARATQQGYSISLYDLDHRPDRLIEFLHALPQRGLDGAIIASGDKLSGRAVRAALDEAQGRGMKLVINGQRLDDLGYPSVISDEAGASSAAVRHLHAQGATPIALIGRSRNSVIATERIRGFERASRELGLGPRPLVLESDFDYASGYAATQRLLRDHPAVRAVITANDQIAVGALAAISDAGLKVPNDLALVSFDDLPFARFLRPSLTSTRPDLATAATLSVNLLLRLVEDEQVPTLHYVTSELVVRDSSRVPVR